MAETWLKKWEPEDPQFWKQTGSKIAWRVLTITTLSLILSFATWFAMSAIVVRLPGIGFKFNPMQLFWLTAMPGLAGGTLRIIHAFVIPIFGSRHVITISTFLKLIPVIGLGMAILNPGTPFWVFLVLAFLAGFGGGDFSSYMPSTSLFFPKRLQGVALGIQAGIGNFGVSLTQFVVPIIITVSIFGGLGGLGKAQDFRKPIPAKTEIVYTMDDGMEGKVAVPKIDPNAKEKPTLTTLLPEGVEVKEAVLPDGKVVPGKDIGDNLSMAAGQVYLQNGILWYTPFLIVFGILCWILIRSVPIKVSLKEQFDIFPNKHTWFTTWTYIMTFGSFSGYSAVFPMMIKTIYGPEVLGMAAPDPLKFAFLGPLVGSLIRTIMGAPSDKWGGSIFTQISGIGMIIGALALIFGGFLTPTEATAAALWPGFVWIMLWIFLMSGTGNAATFRQYPIIFAHSPRQGAGVIGWTAAMAAYGPFIFSVAMGAAITKTGSAIPFFIGAIIFYIIGSWLNWWYYTRPGAEKGDWGTKWGTWYEKQGYTAETVVSEYGNKK